MDASKTELEVNGFNLGGSTKLVGSEMYKIPEPEFKTEVPDIRMQQDPGDDVAKKAAKALLEAEYGHLGRREELFGDEESIKSGNEPGYVGAFIRSIRDLQEVDKIIAAGKIKGKNGENLSTKDLGTIVEAAKEGVREKIAEAYLHIEHIALDELNTVNGFVERLRNGFPYDTRWSIQMFEQLEKKVNAILREKGERKIVGEGREILKMFKRDARWMIATAKISEAMGPGGELYYDGELKLQRLRTPHGEVLASDFIGAFRKELKGLTPSEEERVLTRKILNKIPAEYIGDTPEDIERYGQLLKEKSLREVAIDYQDKFDHWILAGAAAGQRNLENGFVNDLEAGEHYMDIDRVEHRFLNEVLDADRDNGRDTSDNNLVYINAKEERFVVKKRILNPFWMDRDDELAHQAYKTRVHELIVNNDVYEKALEKIRSMPEGNPDEIKQKEEQIVELADRVVLEANKHISDWENLDLHNPFDRLAYTVIDNKVNLERGVLGSGDLGWGWVYEKVSLKDIFENKFGGYVDTGARRNAEVLWRETNKNIIQRERIRVDNTEINGEFIVRRKSELGSIYDNHDVTTVFFWARHIIDYDKMADTRGTLLFPTIGWYRELWESQPPYWRPRVEDFAKDDHLLLKRLGLEGENGILAEGPNAKNIFEDRIAREVYEKGKAGLQPQYYGKFDASVRSYVKENMWAFVTCWLNNPGSGSGEYNLVFPVFLPTMVEDINFWRSVTLKTPSAKVRDYPKETIWHKRLNKTKLSALGWENMPKYKYNWVEVNHDQMERWFGPLITPHRVNRFTGEEFEKHYKKPSGFAEKEGGKRFRLGPRASRWKQGIIRAAVSSQNKVLSSVSISNVMGAEIPNVEKGLRIGSKTVGVELDKWRDDWIVPWSNTLLDMPSEVVGVSNYPGTSAQCLTVSYLQARRIVESAIVHSYGQEGDVIKSIDKIEREFI